MKTICSRTVVFIWYLSFNLGSLLQTVTPASKGGCPGDFVKHHENLSYDRVALERLHRAATEDGGGRGRPVILEFNAYQRVFRLRLWRDISIFASGFEITRRKDTSGPTDVSFLYTGDLEGESDSFCHGSIIRGLFEGLIRTQNGTYYIESASLHHGSLRSQNHSFIYHETDLDYSLWRVLDSDSASEGIHESLQGFQRKMATKLQREKRSLDYSKTSCLLHLQADYLFYQRFGSVEAVVAQIASYVRAVNAIYERVEFEGIGNIDFRVKTLDIVNEEVRSETPYISPEMLLMLHAKSSWDGYCLAFLLTDRDYSGVLGIAFNGQPGDSGGICSKHRNFQDKEASLNTGLITVQKYGRLIPPRMIHITLAHELGHSMGAHHDESKHCSKFDLNTTNGKYLMFGYATDGGEFNNDKLSPCSIAFIANILKVKKDICFVETDRPICGNRIVDAEEECDVGSESEDPCCYGAGEPSGVRCRLKPGALCSSSQGLCCSHDCIPKPKGQLCQEETECASKSICSGSGAECPVPASKPNFTLCAMDSQVCLNGLCTGSLCVRHGLEQCECSSVSLEKKCHLCCQWPGQADTCAPTTSALWEPFFNGSEIVLVPGSPCQDREGYCDMFHFCRFVDEDGPIARVKNFILDLIELDDVATWMKRCWWVILLAVLTLAAMMAGTIFLFGRTVDTETAVPTTLECHFPPPSHSSVFRRHPAACLPHHSPTDGKTSTEGDEERRRRGTNRERREKTEERDEKAAKNSKKNSVDWQFRMQETFFSWEREQIYIETIHQEHETII